MSTLTMLSKKLQLSPLTIQPRVTKLCQITDDHLPIEIKMLENVVEIQQFEATETQTECYLVKFESMNSDWCCYELFFHNTDLSGNMKFNKFFDF